LCFFPERLSNPPSACPVKAGTPIEFAGIIPVNQNDVAGIPELALSIPDFEGQAILRIFSNSTENEIGCFAAQITNGNTFRQPAAVGSVLGVFTLFAVLASFTTAVYGNNVIEIRKHYAHSLSVLVVFAVWHHIFYSGALSMNWPSILVAFWSNYAWMGGMIYSENMQNVINGFIGSNKGNTSHVGAAGTGSANPGLGGGYDLTQIFGRGVLPNGSTTGGPFSKRHLVDATDGFQYYGEPVRPGLPLPGNYSGFAGTLAQERIPASNAFMTGFLWFLILVAAVAFLLIAFKLVLEGLRRLTSVEMNQLAYFRTHYLGYLGAALLRTLFIGFFIMAFLTMFQFSYLAVAGPVAVACIAFIVVVFGIGSVAAFAYYSRIDFNSNIFGPDYLNVEKRKVLKVLPWYTVTRQSRQQRSEDRIYAVSLPWWTLSPRAHDKSIHDDENFTKNYGWLASRYRRTRWWFFILWLVYEFVRACFLAGASGQPMVQVFGLLVVELIAFVSMIILHPFEGQRLNVILTYLLGFSKVSTVALSAAFDTRFGLARIPATVIGIVIIVIQGILTIAVMVAIITGIVTSYLSVVRNQEEIQPRSWESWRKKYFKRMDFEAQDIPRPDPEPKLAQSLQDVPKGPSFNVKRVTRMTKVEDEDAAFMQEAYKDATVSPLALSGAESAVISEPPAQRDRSASFQSQTSHSSLPRAARLHRTNWTLQDHNDVQRRGRYRAMSDTVTRIPKVSDPPSDRAESSCGIRLDTEENLEGRTTPPASSVNRPGTPAQSPLVQTEVHGDESPSTRVTSRLTTPSRASSRPNIETISEEEIPALPGTRSAKESA
jgi:hypothetical protein